MADGNGNGNTLRQDAGTTPSGWDYVDAFFDALVPSLITGTLTLVAAAVQPTWFGNPVITAAPALIVGLSQFASYLRGIYTGKRPSVQI